MLSNRNWLIHSIELEEDKHTDVAAKLDGYVSNLGTVMKQ